jgi:hypothetical protein
MASLGSGRLTNSVLLLTWGVAVSIMSWSSDIVTTGNPVPAAFCATHSGSTQQEARISSKNRAAFKCRCCGRDENGHCNHQCCD